VLLLWFGLSYGLGATGMTAVYWFLAGNVLYYLIGIGLAFRLKDNRAFCKYVCPVTVPLKLASRFALLRIKGDLDKCTDCGACVKLCPMDIRITDYLKANQRVRSTECVLCQTCITVCASEALKLSFGLDFGGQERLREKVQLAPSALDSGD
jgi:polyferredoxin